MPLPFVKDEGGLEKKLTWTHWLVEFLLLKSLQRVKG